MAGNPLLSLLRSCVVRIDAGDEFLGTGFLVAPEEVLTCAHVVHGVENPTVSGVDWKCTGEVTARRPDLEADSPDASFYPLPDIALLRVPGAPVGHPCVRLDPEHPVAGTNPDSLYIEGFSRGEYEPGQVNSSPARLEYKGLLGDDLFKLGRDQVLRGCSGSPALNLRTGSVCAVIDSTRGETSDLGGFGVPIALVADALPHLLAANVKYHAGDSAWQHAVEAERVVERKRQSLGDLPLLSPLVDLDWSVDYPQSELLKARHGVVGLLGREELQEDLGRWRESGEDFGVVLITGAGGFGKTRLALEECARAQLAGWTAGLFAEGLDTEAAAALERLATWPERLFVAIDYAETRPALVSSLLQRLFEEDRWPARAAGPHLSAGHAQNRAGGALRHR